MATKRRLAAIMFTDITGFSAMMEADEDYGRRIRQRHRSVFKEAHAKHDGTILQYYGDGTLSIFDSTTSAVECAVDMQIEYGREPEVPLRIGIHAGDISYDDDGAYGDGLNIAARIEKISIPGSVFISAKVFDDIKNHRWLTAVSLGLFQLRNIHREMELYAVTCKGLDYPSEEEVESYPEHVIEYDPDQTPQIQGHKKKGVAALLAFFFGIFGVHRFYLGKRKSAILWMIASFISLVITATEGPDFAPIAVFGILGFIEFILLLAMPRAEFDQKYNSVKAESKSSRKSKRKKRAKVEREAQSRRSTARSISRSSRPRRKVQTRPPVVAVENSALVTGLKYYKQNDYHEAIQNFERALESDPTSVAASFNLVCSYSILENADKSYYYLAKAVDNGFVDFEKLENHKALSFLRERDDYQNFVDNGYQVVEQLAEPKEDLLVDLQKFNPDILEQIESIGDLLEKGELTRDEFDERKKLILGHDE